MTPPFGLIHIDDKFSKKFLGLFENSNLCFYFTIKKHPLTSIKQEGTHWNALLMSVTLPLG